MKYSELERKIKKAGCYQEGEMRGHPLWYSPRTGKYFKMSNHKKPGSSAGNTAKYFKRRRN